MSALRMLLGSMMVGTVASAVALGLLGMLLGVPDPTTMLLCFGWFAAHGLLPGLVLGTAVGLVLATIRSCSSPR